MTSRRSVVDYIPRTRALYAPSPPYQWADNRERPVPWTPLARPLEHCRVALLGSGGVYLEGQTPFALKDDTSIRSIPSDVSVDRLRISHFGYPTGDAEEDANCVFPLDPLRKLVRDGVLGELAPTAIGTMGGIYSQRRVVVETAPAVVEVLRAEQVDLLFAVPA